MNSDELKELARQWGADAVGVADLASLQGLDTHPEDLFKDFTRAVSIAVRLSDAVVETCLDGPTPIYQQHYLKVNALLDEIALKVMRYIQDSGARALPIPASQLLDEKEWYSYLSHKAVAIAAGIGWQGKSLLVVNPKYGPRIRLVTVLTDMHIKPDRHLKNLCGKCTSCTEACPAKAIKNVNTHSHYADRNEALHFNRCVAKVSKEFRKRPFIDSPICGVCIRVCPFGQKASRRRPRPRTNALP